MRRRTVLLVLGAVLIAAVPAAWAAGKLSKTAIPAISSYCSTLAEPQVSYGPCLTTGKSIVTVDDPVSGNQVGQYTSIAIGRDGLPVMSYFDSTAESLKVAKCADIACTLPKRTITTVVDEQFRDLGKFNSIAIGTDGNPVISFFLGGVDENLMVAKCNDPACAGTDEQISTVDLGDVGKHTSIAIGTDGNPVISNYDEAARNLRVNKCDDPACAPGGDSGWSVDGNPATDVGQFTSIAVGTDGNPVIAYYDATNDALKVAKCNDPGCTGANETTTSVDSVNDDTANTGAISLAVGNDGNPVVSYWDGTNNALKVAKCVDPSCAAAATITTVDETGGETTSIAIGSDGNPVVGYYDSANQVLKVARCSDAACATPAALTTVDTGGVGQFVSAAIGIDRNPIFAYSESAGTLKVARVSH